MHGPLDFDACVIGGGPAGSAVASQLARYGNRTLLVDRGTAWERSIVATMPANVLPLLDAWGAREALDSAGILRRLDTIACWPVNAGAGTPIPSALSLLHVERRRFDNALLQHAAASGVSLIRPGTAQRPARREDGSWAFAVQSSSGRQEIRCRLLVDATAGRLAHEGRSIRRGPPTIALSCVWHADRWPIREGWVEAFEDGWLWSAPLDALRRVVSVFVDAASIRGHEGQPLDRIHRLLAAKASAFSAALAADHACGNVRCCDATPRSAKRHAGGGLIQVGDSSVNLDPLSTQGMLNAIAGGLQAAVVANTLLRRPSQADAAVAFFNARQSQRFALHRARAEEQYERGALLYNTPFWTERVGARHAAPPRSPQLAQTPARDALLRLHPDVRIADVPAIEGDFVVVRPAVTLPGGEPVTHVGQIDLPLLLRSTRFGTSASQLERAWSDRLPAGMAQALLQWLLTKGVLMEDQLNTHPDVMRLTNE